MARHEWCHTLLTVFAGIECFVLFVQGPNAPAQSTGSLRSRKRSAEAVPDSDDALSAPPSTEQNSAELDNTAAEPHNAPAAPENIPAEPVHVKKRRRIVPRVPAGQLPKMTDDHYAQATTDKVVFAKVDGWPAYPAQVSESNTA